MATGASVTRPQTQGIPLGLIDSAVAHPQSYHFENRANSEQEWNPRQAVERPRVNAYWALTAGVYATSWMDMTETQSFEPRFKERDALAKPFLLLPKPLYYASGTMLATGINWLGLKMERSSPWRRIWWLPQVVSIAANLSGYGYTHANAANEPAPSIRFRRKQKNVLPKFAPNLVF